MKVDAKNRNRRLRKKLRVGEFQELGFDLAWKLEDGTDSEGIDQFIVKFFTCFLCLLNSIALLFHNNQRSGGYFPIRPQHNLR